MTLEIVVLKEKHCPRYYAVESPEEYEALALGVLKERYKEGWYGTLDGHKKSLADAIKRVKDSYPEFHLYPQPLSDKQQIQKNRMDAEILELEEEAATDIEFLETLEKLMALPAGEKLQTDRWAEFKSAADLLRHRGDYEYESFEVFTPKKFHEG